MATWDPVDFDRNYMGDEYDKWDDHVMKDLEISFNKLREFNETLNESTDEDTIEMTETTKYALKHDNIEMVANQIYDKLTLMFNKTRERLGIEKVRL